MLSIILLFIVTAVAVVAIALAYHYNAEAKFNLELLNESGASHIKNLGVLVGVNVDLAQALEMAERDNAALSHDLQQYIAANLFDAWTIRNMTASIEALSAQIDDVQVAYAKEVLGAEEYDCTCETDGESICQDKSCTCVHHKWNSLPLDQV